MDKLVEVAAERLVQMPLTSAMSTDMLFVPTEMSVSEAAKASGGTAPILFTGSRDRVEGMITLKSLLENLDNPGQKIHGAKGYVPRTQIKAIPFDANLGQAYQMLKESPDQVLPVMDPSSYILKGYITRDAVNRTLFGNI